MSRIDLALAENLPSPTFVASYSRDGRVLSTRVVTPWYRQILIHDEVLDDPNPDLLTIESDSGLCGPTILQLTAANGWARYQFVEHDWARRISLWRCIEYWGPETEVPDELPAQQERER